MLKFLAAGFAVAGLTAAVGPILIHLLNRRRFRVVEWAAMDFLREALQRNRRILHLRDFLLLLLRVLAVLCVGFALARPFFASTSADDLFRSAWPWGVAALALAALAWAVVTADKGLKVVTGIVAGLALALAGWGVWGTSELRAGGTSGSMSDRQPVHAVLVIDNSRSMGYETLDGDVLAQAKAKAAAFVEQLPLESRISVIPLCGSPQGVNLDAYRNKADALAALGKIEVVDRGGTAAQAIELARQACEQAPELDAKRVVFLGDQQLVNWPAEGLSKALAELPELQVVQVAPENPSNVWVSEFRVQDGVADVETPATFLATISYRGSSALNDVQVSLTVDGVVVASPSVSLEPGQDRQVEFKYRVEVPTEPGRPTYVPAKVEVAVDSVTEDGLKRDNARYLTVPVLSGVPVVFVDQYGAEGEDPAKNQYGETYRLRRLLAPKLAREDATRALIGVRHLRVDQLDERTLADARLVVIAGVESPQRDETVRLLREYVEQGGQLVIAAGGDFDPAAWTALGWQNGAGVLPAPLDDRPFGETPEQTADKGKLKPFLLAYESLTHDYFRIEQEADEALRDLYRLPLFFKAVRAQVEPAAIDALVEAERLRIDEARQFLESSDARRREWAEMERKGTFGPTEEALRGDDDQRRRQLEPRWLTWGVDDEQESQATLTPLEQATRSRPRVVGSYAGNGAPFAVERNVGRGRILFVSTGVYSSWNTLTLTDAMLVFDRIFRSMLERTIPRRNYETGERLVLPAIRSERQQYLLRRPGADADEELAVDALGSDAYGVTIRNPLQAGHYAITQQRRELGGESDSGEPPRTISLAVEASPSESELTTVTAEELARRLGDANYRWIERTEDISLEGAQVRGRDLWKLLISLAFGCLLIEMLVLALPSISRRLSPREETP